jgi:hypothetical protein
LKVAPNTFASWKVEGCFVATVLRGPQSASNFFDLDTDLGGKTHRSDEHGFCVNEVRRERSSPISLISVFIRVNPCPIHFVWPVKPDQLFDL